MTNVVGIDVGGTKVAATLLGPDGMGEHKQQPTQLDSGDALIDQLVEIVGEAAGGQALDAVGIGVPSIVRFETGEIAASTNIPLKGVQLRKVLGERLGVPVFVDNDATVAALAEAHDKDLKPGARNLVIITVGTGIGGGVVIDGRLFSGAHGSACEIGHTIVDPDGPLDSCGQRGCLEVFAGGRNLQRQTGESAVELFQAAEAGDREALTIVHRAATYIGYGLINLTNLFDPEVIVIGGGISRSWKLISPTLEQVLRSSPFITPRRRPKLRRARLGDRAGQVGAVEWAKANS
jgi:glucokinase